MSGPAVPPRPRPGSVWSIGRLRRPVAARALGPTRPRATRSSPPPMSRPGRRSSSPTRSCSAATAAGTCSSRPSRPGPVGGSSAWPSATTPGAGRIEGSSSEEPFHLSYPHVFAHGSEVYMTPETLALGCVVLYRADPFPERWRPEAELIAGQAADPTPFRHDGRWWMFACAAGRTAGRPLRLFHVGST